MALNEKILKEISGFADDLKEALDRKIDISADFDSICICGMGASAIGGDIIKDITADRSNVQVSVVRGFDMPEWVNKNTLVIVSSYSGNTRETLSLYDQAMERGCEIVAIASGGKLAEKCRNDNNFLIEIRPMVQPRNALGYILGYMANVMETIGAASHRTEMKKLIPRLRKFNDDIGFDNTNSFAKDIASRISGTIPVIHSTAGIASSAVRWKQQINENSKMLAFCGSIPEFNHNEIVGWSGSKIYNCIPIILYEDGISEMMNAITEASIDALMDFDAEPIVVNIPGATITERILRAIMIGDYVSIYLAGINGVDPLDVGPIAEFKKRISGLFDTR